MEVERELSFCNITDSSDSNSKLQIMLFFDTAPWPRGGIALPPTHRGDDGDVAFIQYGKGSANDDAARATTPLRASTLPPHRFLVDAAAAAADGGGDDLSRSTSTTTSGVSSLRVGALTPLCPGTFNSSSSPFFCVQALWPGQEESEAWPPLPVPLSPSSSSPSSSLPPLSSSSFELRAPVVSRGALDSYFSSCGGLCLRVLPFSACGERERESGESGDECWFLEASLPLVPGGRCDDDDHDEADDEGLSRSSPSPVATLSVSLRISVAGLERSFDGELNVAKRRRRRRRAAEAEAKATTATTATTTTATTEPVPPPPLPRTPPARAEEKAKKRPPKERFQAAPPVLTLAPPEFRGQRALLTVEILSVHLPATWRPPQRQQRYRVSYRLSSSSSSSSSGSAAAAAAAAVPSLLLRHSVELPSRPTAGSGARISGRGGEAPPLAARRRTHRVSAGPALAAALSGGSWPVAAAAPSSSRSPAPAPPPALFITIEALESDDNDENDPRRLGNSSSSLCASASLPLRSLLRAPKSRARDPSKRVITTSAPLVRSRNRENKSDPGSRASLLTPGAARVEVRVGLDLDPCFEEWGDDGDDDDEANEEEEEGEEEEGRFEETEEREEREASLPLPPMSGKPLPPPSASSRHTSLRAPSSSSYSSVSLPKGIAEWLGSDLNWRSCSGGSKSGGGGDSGGGDGSSAPPPPPPLAPPSFSSSPRNNPLFTDKGNDDDDRGGSGKASALRLARPVTIRIEAARGLLLPLLPSSSTSFASAFVAFEAAAAAPGSAKRKKLVCTPASPLISPPAGAAAGLCVTWGFEAPRVFAAAAAAAGERSEFSSSSPSSSSLLLHVWLRPREASLPAPASFGLTLGSSFRGEEQQEGTAFASSSPSSPPAAAAAAAAGDELLGTASVSVPSPSSSFSSSPLLRGEFSRAWLPLVDARGDARGELLVSVREEVEEAGEGAKKRHEERAAEPPRSPQPLLQPLPEPSSSPPAVASPTTLRARLEADLAELDAPRESLEGGRAGAGSGGGDGGGSAVAAQPTEEELEDLHLANLRRLSQVAVCSDDDADHSLAFALAESPSSSSDGSDFGGAGFCWSEELQRRAAAVDAARRRRRAEAQQQRREQQQRASRLGQAGTAVTSPPPPTSPVVAAQERPLPPPGVPAVTLGTGAFGTRGSLTTAAGAAPPQQQQQQQQQQRRPSALADDSWAFGCRRSGDGAAAAAVPASSGISFSNSLPPARDGDGERSGAAAAATASRPRSPPPPPPMTGTTQPENEDTSTSTATATRDPARPRFSFSNSLPPPSD